MQDSHPKLVFGPAFHLEGDGQWDVQELPEEVLHGASYSGIIKIKGFPVVVYEMPDGDQWAQKAPGVPSPKGDEDAIHRIQSSQKMALLAARVAFPRTGKIDVSDGGTRAVQGLLSELSKSKKILDKAVQHSRSLEFEAKFDWVVDQVDSLQETFNGTFKGIRESLEYILRQDLADTEESDV